MSKYLWINPVAEKMYGKDIKEVQKALSDKGYILATCEPQLEYVRGQYKAYAQTSQKTILDCRCPEAIRVVKSKGFAEKYAVPDIEPILVRTARVLYEKYIGDGDQLIITCPCTQLRDFTAGQLKDKKEVVVYTWKEFAEKERIKFLSEIEETPIPLGFFDETFERVLKLSTEEDILTTVKADQSQYDIVEMLYCKDGCHNGDGL